MSQSFFFRCEFLNETWFLNKNWIQKLSFWKIFLLQNMIIRNVLYSKSAGTKNSQFKTWHFGFFSFKFSLCRKNFAPESDFFFWKFHFKLWFSMKKVPTKSCLLKWVRKVNNLLFCAEQIETKPYFLDVMFLSKYYPQWNLNSKSKFQKKILSPQNDYWKNVFRNPPGRKTLD